MKHSDAALHLQLHSTHYLTFSRGVLNLYLNRAGHTKSTLSVGWKGHTGIAEPAHARSWRHVLDSAAMSSLMVFQFSWSISGLLGGVKAAVSYNPSSFALSFATACVQIQFECNISRSKNLNTTLNQLCHHCTVSKHCWVSFKGEC